MASPPVEPASARWWSEFQTASASGLRAKAASALAAFSASLSAGERTAFTRWFCHRRYGRNNPERMHSHSMPLARDVVLPVLLKGARRGQPEPLRWLVHVALDARMRTDLIAPYLHERSAMAGVLAAALARNADAADLWRIAFHFELWTAEWGVHHLSEGVLILPEQDCLRSVAHARQILAAAPDGALAAEDLRDLETVSGLLADFRVWSDAGAPDAFPDWCRDRGRSYELPVPVYYDR